MAKKIFVLLIYLSAYKLVEAQGVILRKGMTINKSIMVKKAIYQFQGNGDLNGSVIFIEGSNIVVDFNKAILKGNNSNVAPDQFSGIAIKIIGGHNIVIKNLTVKGYKIAIFGKDIKDLKIENCDLSYNYRQHLKSSQQKEDLSDWMSYHQNEKDEWLRYGAAIYLRGCANAIISNIKVTGGQNGLMMMECNNAIIYNNNFSFNSGIGLGMYRCCNNKVLYNKIDFNVRGYSDGVYSRGQDSADILVYEQSNDNLFYKNSATHGGDGFFLWAGQTTMDKGIGGCNDNILQDNDFSYAPANGIEATFSTNKIIHNRIFGCSNGIWGGYSYNARITQNQFRFNNVAIAIEHGANIYIDHNLFYQDKAAIKIWADKEDTVNWNYPKQRDTRSRNYFFIGNSFNKDSIIYSFVNTDSIKIFDNRNVDFQYLIKADSTVTNVDSTADEETNIHLSDEDSLKIPMVQNPIDPFKGSGKLKGRENILMTEWGPYNFNYPLIWNNNPADSTDYVEFSVLGPKGKWKILLTKGLTDVINNYNSFPAKIFAKRIKDSNTDIEIQAVYTGDPFVDEFGNKITSSKKYLFHFKSRLPR